MEASSADKLSGKMLDVSIPQLLAVVERAKVGALNAEDHETLTAAIHTLGALAEELKNKSTSILRLKKLLFGASTESTSRVFGKKHFGESSADKKDEKKRVPGHGRRSAAAYTGAQRLPVTHATLHSGDDCPGCLKGKVYPLPEPHKLIRITGMAPLSATIWECERLRCNLCGEVHTAKAPQGVGDKKYDESASSMVGLLKYGAGLPFNRIEKLQEGFGIPLPAATQWELVQAAAGDIKPAYDELIRQAAQGDVLHNDDTTAKILDLTPEQREAAAADDEAEDRTGVFTTGIISQCGDKPIALFFTGPKHAGENLADVLAKRADGLSPPIQMCDALPVNTAGNFESILANCNAHARRNFVDIADNFPEHCRHVIETFREVYRNDASAKKQQLSPQDRLLFHQANSAALMENLLSWMQQQLDEHLVEPNSELGKAFGYMIKHWDKLTLFLRKAGAPLDNNICERALKKAILHRKNSLFFRSLNGAGVGDIFMSLIHTAELHDISPFDYIVALQRNRDALSRDPSQWMPWNYRKTAELVAANAPSD
jgi:hypothetical protein